MEAEANSQSESCRLGRYEIIVKLASGGMGEVFLARSIGAAGFQKHVVIKKILPHLVEQPQIVEALVHEAKLLVMLDHPNIVQVLDLGMDGSNYFMAMEFVQGYNLSSIIGYCAKQRRVIPVGACTHIVSEILAGLEYIHELRGADGTRMNIIHRDVSPQNVLLSKEGRVKLTDFGIAKVLHEAEGVFTRSLKGKLRYMAPEALDTGRIDQRYDLFAAGIVLFESLCRAHLYTGRSDVDLMNKVRRAMVPPLDRFHPGLPAELKEVVLRALAKNAQERFQTAAEFSAALRDALQPMTTEEAAAELRSLLNDIYSREDFPLGKPKLPDLTTMAPATGDTLTLHSRVDLVAGQGPEIRARAAPPPPRRLRLAVGLLSLGLLAVGAVVAYLAYTILLKAGSPLSLDRPPVIIVEKRGRNPASAADASRAASPAAEAGARPEQAPARSAALHRPTRPPHRPFSSEEGASIFRRHGTALARCFRQHTSSTDPELSIRVVSTIRSSGRVSAVQIEPAGQADTPMGQCITRVARKIRYPRHDRESVNFLQPLRVTRSPE